MHRTMSRTTVLVALLASLSVALLGCQDTTAPGNEDEEFALVSLAGSPQPVEVWFNGVTRMWLVGGSIRFTASTGRYEWRTGWRVAGGRDSTGSHSDWYVASGPYRILGRSDTLMIRGDTLRRLGEREGMAFRRVAR